MKNLILILFLSSVWQLSVSSQHLAMKMEVSVLEDSLQYLLYLPGSYTGSERSWPLLVFLHGSGESGSDIHLVEKNGPPMLIEQGEKFPFIVTSPQCHGNERWSVEVLEEFLDNLLQRYRIDTARVYLSGLSMGGEGTWNWAKAHPGRFAAIAPVCGWADTIGIASIKELPVWVFHGAKDEVVPLYESQRMVDALKEMGCDVRFTIYPEAGHDAWTETYENPEFYKWMLKQKR
jgi:predicted peptidase